MCKVYNPVGCLTVVKSHLKRHRVNDFNSLKEVIAFQKGYETLRNSILSNSELAFENEKIAILSENKDLKLSIDSTKIAAETSLVQEIEDLKAQLYELATKGLRGRWKRIMYSFKSYLLKRKIIRQERALPGKVSEILKPLLQRYLTQEERYIFISSRSPKSIHENYSSELIELDSKMAVIDEVANSIYGALGEHEVVKELRRLSDEYVLINDFCMSFNPPLYNRKERDYIQSIQVDHLLVGPSGVFIIETKNWSKQSINNASLRSPISQLKRSNYAIFTVLNKENYEIGLKDHHWGKRKIDLKGIVVLLNQRPEGDFQHVKVLTVHQLLGYVKYFPPIYTSKETEGIANKLMMLASKCEPQ